MTGEFRAEDVSFFISRGEFGSSGGAFLAEVGQTFLQQLAESVVGDLQVMRLHNDGVKFLRQPLGTGGAAQWRRAIGFDKTAAALANFDDAFSFQLAVSAGCRVAIDAQFFRQRADRWKRIARLERATCSRRLDLLHDLQIDRNTGPEVDVNED